MEYERDTGNEVWSGWTQEHTIVTIKSDHVPHQPLKLLYHFEQPGSNVCRVSCVVCRLGVRWGV
jgi:hypothetical protein